MARVNEIITRARDTLAEKTPKRWSNERLLRALSEGQKKIAQELLSVRAVCTIEICDLHHTYKLDTTNVLTPNGRPIRPSAVYNRAGQRARFVTSEIIEDENPDWRTEKGDDITHIIYDKQNPLFFRVYPIPDDSKLKSGVTFNTADNPITDAASICAAVSTPSNFDITAEVAPAKLEVHFYHTPPDITTIADTNLLIAEEFDIALKYYITGMVLRDDKDPQNRTFGREELALYDSQYQFAQDLVRDNYVDHGEEHHAGVRYNAVIRADQ